MPELPEVETVANDLRSASLVGCTIKSSRVYWPRTISSHTTDQFNQQIKGLRFLGVSRRAKYLIFELTSEKLLIVHLRMTGQFSL